MTNHPEDCAHKQCPWNEPEPVECNQCATVLDEDELVLGLCRECVSKIDICEV